MIKQDTKKIFLETYGCQMNVYDTELVKAILAKANYDFTQEPNDADVVMLNTCAIRENAHRKVYGRIHDLKYRRGEKPLKIGILGCMATNLRTNLLENRNLDIDFIAGPDSYKRLPALIAESFATDTKKREGFEPSSKPFDLTLSEFETYSDVYPARREGVNAWIACMRGCNNFCTFCVVPYTRGRERSRGVDNIVDEAKCLADDGFKQVTLLGQNVNSYFHDGKDFADLINAVSRVNGIKRIRFTSPHPKDFPEKLLREIADNPKVCKQIHLPLQSGSTRILDLMNRAYSKEEFLDLVEKTRALIPNVALSTDIIVGFSSETDAEFGETVAVIEKARFDSAFIYKYSERKNTIAERKHPDDVPEAIKTERIVQINELQKQITLAQYEKHIGEVQEMLIEDERTTRSTEHFFGRLDNNKTVIIPRCEAKRGDFIPVKITQASPSTLRGVAL